MTETEPEGETELPYAGEQRERVVDDLCRWKIEYEDFEMAESERETWRSRLSEMDDEELRDTWYDCVGEWLCSRADLPWDEHGTDQYLDEQFQSLLSGQATEYGFVV